MFVDWSKEEWHDFGIGCGYVLASFAFFRILQFIIRWYLFGKCTFRTFSYFAFRRRANGELRRQDSTTLSVIPPNKKWRICNEANSLIHSVISGLWAAYCILSYENLIQDMIGFRADPIVNLIFLTTGYLLHDLLDLLINERSVRIIELLFHHVIVLIGFATTQITLKFLGVVVFGLLMELNSIFLHSRSLLNLYGMNKKGPAFKMIALLNMVTLIVFRMAVSIYLMYWQISVAMGMAWNYALVTFVVIASLLVTNTVLAYRVMAADGLLGSKRARRGPRAEDEATVDEDKEEEEDIEDEDRPDAVSVQLPGEERLVTTGTTSTIA